MAAVAPTFPINGAALLDTIRQNSIDYSEYFPYTIFRTNVCVYRGVHCMNENEIMLINRIRKSNDPEMALRIATDIILAYLTQKESSQSQSAALLQEACATA